jgi:hypothetical protein
MNFEQFRKNLTEGPKHPDEKRRAELAQIPLEQRAKGDKNYTKTDAVRQGNKLPEKNLTAIERQNKTGHAGSDHTAKSKNKTKHTISLKKDHPAAKSIKPRKTRKADMTVWDSEDRKEGDRIRTDRHKDKLEKDYKKDAKDYPKIEEQAMNFSEWQDSLCPALYEVNSNPACPPGYKWNKKQMMCVPKTAKDDVSKNDKRDSHPGNGPGYHTIGSHGQNGAPYAYEEPATSDSVSEAHNYDEEDDDDKRFKKEDDRMKYGKDGKPSSLRPGEVRKYNKETGKWESNKK